MGDQGESSGSWTLLTGHGHVLVEIARNPDARIRDISAVVGLTDRTVQAIVADLEAAGYLTRTRTGRRTRYSVNHDSLFRHSAQEGLRVGPFLELLAVTGDDSGPEPAAGPAPAGGKTPGSQAGQHPGSQAGQHHGPQAGQHPGTPGLVASPG